MELSSEAKIKAIAVPIDFLSGLFVNKIDSINNMILSGVVHYSEKLNLDVREVLERVLYEFAQGRNVPDFIKNIIAELDLSRKDFFITEGNFQVPSKFKTYHVMNDLSQKLEFIEVKEFAKFISALVTCGFENKQNRYEKFLLAKSLPAGKIFAMINVDTLKRFRDEDQSDLQLATFAVFIACKSIIGRKKFAKTNIGHIVSRAFPIAENEPENAPKLKYQTRRRFTTIRERLEFFWGMKFYSAPGIRGFYMSDKNGLPLVELAKKAHEKKLKLKREKLKKDKAEATKISLQELR